MAEILGFRSALLIYVISFFYVLFAWLLDSSAMLLFGFLCMFVWGIVLSVFEGVDSG